MGECVLQLEQVQFNYHQELQAANVPDTSVISANIPDASEAGTEFQSLSAGVNRLVQNEAADSMTVEEEIDKNSLDRMSIDTTFALKHKIDLQHLSKTEAKKINLIIEDYPKVWAASKYSVGRFTGFDAYI